MKTSTKNSARGDADIVKGKAKEITGKLVRSKKLELRGKAQAEVGRIEKSVAKRQKARGE